MVPPAGQSVASCSAGVCALWGWRHGGANVAVIEMLQRLVRDQVDLKNYIERVKKREVRLMGFGHRIYKNYDRVRGFSRLSRQCVEAIESQRPAPRYGRRLEEVALSDSYFSERNLYPNVTSIRHHSASHRYPRKHVHGDVCHRSHARLDRQLERSQRPPEIGIARHDKYSRDRRFVTMCRSNGGGSSARRACGGRHAQQD